MIKKNIILSFIFIMLLSMALSCRDSQNYNPGNKIESNNLENKNSSEKKADSNTSANQAAQYTVNIINKYPHDPKAFTQGLFFHDGVLYESTGLKVYSTLRKDDFKTGKVIKKYQVPAEYFAEGACYLDKKIYQLTWQNNVCFVYDFSNFKLLKKMDLSGEGWGITTDGKVLFISDGTNIIRICEPENLKILKIISVSDNNYNPVNNLNELEYINGEIWANVWMTDKIVCIDPNSGIIKAWIDLSILRTYLNDEQKINIDVINGIAIDNTTNKIYLTGKNWPFLFEIALVRTN